MVTIKTIVEEESLRLIDRSSYSKLYLLAFDNMLINIHIIYRNNK